MSYLIGFDKFFVPVTRDEVESAVESSKKVIEVTAPITVPTVLVCAGIMNPVIGLAEVATVVAAACNAAPGDPIDESTDGDVTIDGDVSESEIEDPEGTGGDGDTTEAETEASECTLTATSDQFTIEGSNQFIKNSAVWGLNGNSIYRCSAESECEEKIVIKADNCDGAPTVTGVNPSGDNIFVGTKSSLRFVDENGMPVRECDTIKNEPLGENCTISMNNYTAGLLVGDEVFAAGSIQGCSITEGYAIVKIKSDGRKPVQTLDESVISMKQAGSGQIAILMESGTIAFMDTSSMTIGGGLSVSGADKMVVDGSEAAVKSGQKILISDESQIDLEQNFSDFDMVNGVISAITTSKKILICDRNEETLSVEECSFESTTRFNKIFVIDSLIYMMTDSKAQIFEINRE